MGLSNMLSKLFKKENADLSVQNPVKFKDFDSIIVPPEPKTRSILVYKTLNLGLEFTPGNGHIKTEPAEKQSSLPADDEVLLTDDMAEEVAEED